MIDDDEDFLSDDEDDATPDPALRPGVLSVPGTARNETEFKASAVGYSADYPILIVDHDPEKNEVWISPDSFEALRAAGWKATPPSIASAETFLSPSARAPGKHNPGGISNDGPPR